MESVVPVTPEGSAPSGVIAFGPLEQVIMNLVLDARRA
jgi:hypothetical protein